MAHTHTCDMCGDPFLSMNALCNPFIEGQMCDECCHKSWETFRAGRSQKDIEKEEEDRKKIKELDGKATPAHTHRCLSCDEEFKCVSTSCVLFHIGKDLSVCDECMHQFSCPRCKSDNVQFLGSLDGREDWGCEDCNFLFEPKN